jgi:hypothetical protein
MTVGIRVGEGVILSIGVGEGVTIAFSVGAGIVVGNDVVFMGGVTTDAGSQGVRMIVSKVSAIVGIFIVRNPKLLSGGYLCRQITRCPAIPAPADPDDESAARRCQALRCAAHGLSSPESTL